MLNLPEGMKSAAVLIAAVIATVKSAPIGVTPGHVAHHQHEQLASVEAIEPGSFKLFGSIIRPGQAPPSSKSALPRPFEQTASPSKSHSQSPSPPSSPLPWTPAWIVDNVKYQHQRKYVALLDRLKIRDNYKVRAKFLTSLTPRERKTIEEQDVQGIKRIISDRPHLSRFAPEEYPDHIRPTSERLEAVKKNSIKISNGLRRIESWRKKKENWDTQHPPEVAESIRQLTMQLHETNQWTQDYNSKIAKMSPEERLKALDNDEEALYKLGPKLKRRRPRDKQSQTAETADESARKRTKQR